MLYVCIDNLGIIDCETFNLFFYKIIYYLLDQNKLKNDGTSKGTNRDAKL